MFNPLTGMYDNRIEKSRRLTDIELAEISLVNKAANKKKFLFFKSSNEGSCIDLLDILEAIEENYSISADESAHIEKALKVLNVLDTEDIESLSNVILLLSKLVEPDTEVVSKSDKLWPSFAQRSTVQKTEPDDKDALWPSLECVI